MLAVGILLLSSTVAINLLLEDSPVVIQLEGDTFKVVDIPYVYTVKEAYILLFSGFLGGLALAQVLHYLGFSGSVSLLPGPAGQGTAVNLAAEAVPMGNFEVSPDNSLENFRENSPENGNSPDNSPDNSPEELRPAADNIAPTDVLLRALEGDERKAVELIVQRGGRILQNELVNSLGFSKAKVSRVLMNLERRGIIDKKKYGLTNCISIADELSGDIGTKGEMK
ncbi:helix-turn-helix transcriptional regulator [Methanosarcina sp. Mfa9]|uniref:helix-turn-helix transcriptional regulator n=1 Tax=Methanosarcina sp. Mfa9 TaxID=3439063 RepID=UPI003F874084